MSKILIIDDDRTICKSLILLLSKANYEAEAIHNPLNCLAYIEAYKPELILLDMNFSIETSGKQGIELLTQIKSQFPAIDIILITGWGTISLAIEGMKLGAKDFITKPWNNEHLLDSIQNSIDIKKDHELIIDSSLDRMIGNSEPMLEVKRLIQKVAKTNASVLITGESGTGKELVAEAIHDLSKRNKESFVKVNLGGLSSTLFESELFGHVKGAFTGAYQHRMGRFEQADKGSIFLDEIGELELPLQVKLLRVLQEKTFEPIGSNETKRVDIRVISATHKNLQELVKQEKFREDLFYRINLMHIHLPALHERKTDIPAIATFVVNQLNVIENKQVSMSQDAQNWLANQVYSGNIRQLKNLIERAYLLAEHNQRVLEIKHLKPHFQFMNTTSVNTIELLPLHQMEENLVRRAMNYHYGNISLAAQALGITRSALYRRLEKYNINREPGQ